MKIWHIVLGCAGVVAFCLFLLITIPALLFYFRPGGLDAEFPPAAVLAGEGSFTKTLLLDDNQFDSITYIGPISPAASPTDGLLVVSWSGALYLDAQLKVQSFVPIADSATHVDVVDTNKDGKYEFFRRGGWAEDAALIDDKGNIVWTYGGMPGIDDMAAGDLDGDGTISFAAGFNGGGGIHRIDGSGKRVWKKSGGNIWHVEIFDTDGDGKSEVLHSDAGGKITVRNGDGEVVRTFKVGDYVGFFSTCKWPEISQQPLLVVGSDGEILVADTTGKVLKRFDAPNSVELADCRGIPVAFAPGQPAYFAALETRGEQSLLFIFDAAGKLVYEESLDDAGEALSTRTENAAEGQTLLVGGDGRVWQYRLTSAPAQP